MEEISVEHMVTELKLRVAWKVLRFLEDSACTSESQLRSTYVTLRLTSRIMEKLFASFCSQLEQQDDAPGDVVFAMEDKAGDLFDDS